MTAQASRTSEAFQPTSKMRLPTKSSTPREVRPGSVMSGSQSRRRQATARYATTAAGKRDFKSPRKAVMEKIWPSLVPGLMRDAVGISAEKDNTAPPWAREEEIATIQLAANAAAVATNTPECAWK